MGSYDVAGAELKRSLKQARKDPVSFAFNPSDNDETTYCGMHRTKSPSVLGKEAKDEGQGAKHTFGTAQVAGKTVTLTVERDLPGLAKKFKRFLKSQKVMLNVVVMDGDGNVIDSDIEEGLPDDPDLDGDEEGDAGLSAAQAAPPPPPPPPPPPADTAALARRLAEMRPRIAALPAAAQDRLAGPFRDAVEAVRAGDLARGTAGANRIEQALALLARQAGEGAAPPPPPAPPGPDLGRLRQAAEGLRIRAEGLPTDATRTALLEALARATGLLDAGEAEQAIAILKKVQALMARVADGAPAAPDSGEAAWDARFAALEPRVNAALSQGLIADVDGLRRQWMWATGQAADGAFDKALAALPEVEALLDAAPAGGSGFTEGLAPEARQLARARVIWSGARATMLAEVGRLEGAILAAMADDPEQAAVAGAVGALTVKVQRLDARLEDKMDEVVNSPPGPDRETRKDEARSLIAAYRATLDDSFFKDVDGASGFGNFAVTATAVAALAEIEAILS